jgi:hypothetical protein
MKKPTFPPIQYKYYSFKRFLTFTENGVNLDSNCDCLQLENQGETLVTLYSSGEKVELEPGDVLMFQNKPGILEITHFEKIQFSGIGKKKLFIIKSYLTNDPRYKATEQPEKR